MPTKSLHRIHLEVKTLTGLHIGALPGTGSVSDSPVRRRANGQFEVPGTGIAGALRGHLTRIAPALTGLATQGKKIVCDALTGVGSTACGCVVCHLMGDINPVHDGSDVRSSRLIVHNAMIIDARIHIRDGVGMDRVTGTASRQTMSKFDLEVIPAGVKFNVDLDLEAADEIDQALVALLIEEWQAGRIYLGGWTRRGLGKLKVESVQFETLDLANNLGDLMALLRRQQVTNQQNIPAHWKPGRRFHGQYRGVINSEVSHERDLSLPSWLRVDYTLQARGFFLANDVSEAHHQGFNHLAAQYLPGASIRGVLRSRAEEIARTLTMFASSSEREFLDKCPASHPLSAQLLDNRELYLESTTSRISRRNDRSANPSLDSFDLAEQLFGTTFYGSRLFIEDATLISQPVWKPLDFVAVDRFTGGAADQMKFDALALWKPRFEGSLYLESPQPWEIGWLLYTLKDGLDGHLTFGFGARKGFGAVSLPQLRFTLGWTYDEAFPASIVPAPAVEGFFRQVAYDSWDELPVDLKQDWANAWLHTIANYQVAIPHQDGTDPYWSDERVLQLYPMENQE